MEYEQIGEWVEVCTEQSPGGTKEDLWKLLIELAPRINQLYESNSFIEQDFHDLVNVSNGSSMNIKDLLCAYGRLTAHLLVHDDNPKTNKEHLEANWRTANHRKRKVRRSRNAAVDKLIREWTDPPETTSSNTSSVRLDTHYLTLFNPKIREANDVKSSVNEIKLETNNFVKNSEQIADGNEWNPSLDDIAEIKTELEKTIESQPINVKPKSAELVVMKNSNPKRITISQNTCLDCGTSNLSTRAKRCLKCFEKFRRNAKSNNCQAKREPIPLGYTSKLDVEKKETEEVVQTVTPVGDQPEKASITSIKCVNKNRACNECGKQVSAQSSGRCRPESSLGFQSPQSEIELIDLTIDDDSEPETPKRRVKCSKCRKKRLEFKNLMCSGCYKKPENKSTSASSQNDDVIFAIPTIPSARSDRLAITSNVPDISAYCSSTNYLAIEYSNSYYDLRVRSNTRNKCGTCGQLLEGGKRRCSRCQHLHQMERTVAVFKRPRFESPMSLDIRGKRSSSVASSVASSTVLTVSKVEKRKTSQCQSCPTMIVPNKSGYCRACYNQSRHVAGHRSSKKPKVSNSAANFEVSNEDEIDGTIDLESSFSLPCTQDQMSLTNNPADEQESSRAYYNEQLNDSLDSEMGFRENSFDVFPSNESDNEIYRVPPPHRPSV
ncbi:hypothetical protein M3Y98_00283100 [Aphelenchoides besseyi]|nr:hypothetical protein M3Y98_00283100 [Aphelenchoides besseyi]